MSEPVNSVTVKVLQPLWNESSPRTNNCLAYSNYSYSRIGPKERALQQVMSFLCLVFSSVSSPVSVPPYPHSSGNILSQWFSEDMLKQAGPQTSVTPDVARRVMSVEELERQQATVRN